MSKIWAFIGGVVTGIAGVVAAAIIDEKLEERKRDSYCEQEELTESREEVVLSEEHSGSHSEAGHDEQRGFEQFFEEHNSSDTEEEPDDGTAFELP